MKTTPILDGTPESAQAFLHHTSATKPKEWSEAYKYVLTTLNPKDAAALAEKLDDECDRVCDAWSSEDFVLNETAEILVRKALWHINRSPSRNQDLFEAVRCLRRLSQCGTPNDACALAAQRAEDRENRRLAGYA